MPNATPETRRNVYERARQALIGQLRKIDPPVPESDIERESSALDEAVAKLEAELSAKAKTDATVKPATSPPRSTPVPPRVSAPPPIKSPSTEQRPGFPSTLGSGVRMPRASGPAVLEKSAPSSTVTPPPVLPRPSVPPTLGPAQREPSPGRGPNLPPPVRAPEPTGAAKRAAETTENRPSPAVQDQPAEPQKEAASAKRDWRGFGRPRDATLAAAEAAAFPAEANPVEPPKPPSGRTEPARPLAPQPKPPRGGFGRHWIVVSIVAVVVAIIAGMAFMLRDNPAELARRAPGTAPPPAESSQPAGKIVERVGGGPSTSPSNPPAATAPVAHPAVPGAAASTTAPDNILPVAQRAALLVQAPDQPQQTKTYVGTVIWRRENVNHGQGQPLGEAVRADIDLPEAKLKATMTFQKNTDATLPASHTIELRFMPAGDSPIPAVKQIDVPQMRKEDAPAGDPLAGVPAPITQNYFLIGLSQGDATVARNTDLLKSRQWFDIPLLLSDNKIAKLTFEKGDPGDRALSDAFADWQQQPPPQ